MNVSDLRKVLGLPDLPDDDDSTMDNGERGTNEGENVALSTASNMTRGSSGSSTSRQIRVRRQSMEQLDLIKVFDFSYFPFVYRIAFAEVKRYTILIRITLIAFSYSISVDTRR